MHIIKHRNIFAGIGGSIILVSVGILVFFGLRLGIDFTGGALTEVVYTESPTQTKVENAIEALDWGGSSVRQTESTQGREGFIIRTRDLSETERQQLVETLAGLGDGSEITRFTSIGPAIGEELADKAKWAIFAVALVIILYVAIAFVKVGYPVRSWVYGGITIVALIHDVLVPTAVMAVLGVTMGVEVDVLFVTAILAVLGYSVNDTIVVFDRVRENLHKNRTEHVSEYKDVTGVMQKSVTYRLTKPFADIVDLSVKQIITRSINTSLTTTLALGALFFMGGETTQVFSLILIAGVLAGTYSSIFLASPLLAVYTEYVAKLPVDLIPEDSTDDAKDFDNKTSIKSK